MSIIKVDIPNPPDIDTTYATIELSRSPDNSTWSVIAAAITIDPENEYTDYEDDSGSTSSYYRWRYRKPSAGAYSDPSTGFIVGDSVPRQWVKANITDTAIGNALWNQWLEESMTELWTLGIWYEDTQTITPADAAGTTVTAEYYNLTGRLRDVFSVELVEKDSPNHHLVWLTADEWSQENRRLRLFEPDENYKYVAHGKAQYKRLGQLTDDYYDLVLWMLRKRYVDFQLDKRKDFRRYIVSDPSRDITIEQLNILREQADREIARRVAALEERAVGYPAS